MPRRPCPDLTAPAPRIRRPGDIGRRSRRERPRHPRGTPSKRQPAVRPFRLTAGIRPRTLAPLPWCRRCRLRRLYPWFTALRLKDSDTRNPDCRVPVKYIVPAVQRWRQGLRIATPAGAKSDSLRVTTVNRRHRAVAAISPSIAGSGFFKRAVSLPHSSATRPSIARTRFSNHAGSSFPARP